MFYMMVRTARSPAFTLRRYAICATPAATGANRRVTSRRRALALSMLPSRRGQPRPAADVLATAYQGLICRSGRTSSDKCS